MAKVRLREKAREKFANGMNLIMAVHRNVDTVIAELNRLNNADPVNIDHIVLLLSHQLSEHKDSLNAIKADPTLVDTLAKEHTGDATFDFVGAIDETITRIDALNTWIQANVPSTDVGGKKVLHFYEMLPSGKVVLITRTKAQLVAAGIVPLLQGFVNDRLS